jgi:hypothetical protein
METDKEGDEINRPNRKKWIGRLKAEKEENV